MISVGFYACAMLYNRRPPDHGRAGTKKRRHRARIFVRITARVKIRAALCEDPLKGPSQFPNWFDSEFRRLSVLMQGKNNKMVF
jgi:hypothetical protein